MRLTIALFFVGAVWGQTRQVAISFDDLPRGGDQGGVRRLSDVTAMTMKLMRAIEGVPVAAFVNPKQERDFGESGLAELLEMWRRQGAELGNHTFSHPDLNKMPLAEYEADILLAEPAIRRARGGSQSRYFRHPFLHAGKDEETKNGLSQFLVENGYLVAPVTIDNSDWLFARVYTAAKDKKRVRDEYVRYLAGIFEFFEKRSVEVVGREFPQVLLLHASQLNADAMGEVLGMLRRRGYQFVTLDEALKDEVYRMKDGYVGANGISWVHRWGVGLGLALKFEPGEPKWVLEEFRRLKR